MILEILTYPNKKLFERSMEVTSFDQELHKFLDDMYDTMISENGIGLAAIQVGVAKRIFIVNIPNEDSIQDKSELVEVINPIFESKEGEIIFQEGCLSVPGFFEEVRRAEKIKLKYQDRHGKHCEIDTYGLMAIALQHENDHLDGHLFIEHIGFNKRKKFNKDFKQGKIKKQIKEKD